MGRAMPPNTPDTPDTYLPLLTRIVTALEEQARAWREALEVRATLSVEIIRLQGRLDMLEREKDGLCTRLDTLEGAHDRTGQQSVADLRDALKREQDSKSHWTRWVVASIVAFASAVVMLLLGRMLVKPGLAANGARNAGGGARMLEGMNPDHPPLAPGDVSALVNLLLHLTARDAWLSAAPVIIGALVRALKSYPDLFPMDPRARVLVAVVLGVASGVSERVVLGTPLATALAGGVVSAALAVLGHEVFVEWLRKGRELGVKPTPKGDPQ